MLSELKQRVLSGEQLDRESCLKLWEMPLEDLCRAGDEIRSRFCGNGFDLCSIVNAKCGRCPEDCRYCAQSAHYPAKTEEYPLLQTEALLDQARYYAQRGVLRYSLVTSGRSLSDKEVEQACLSIRAIREEVGIQVCVSFGLLGKEQFRKVKEAGAGRVHCNLESSQNYFSNVCTTHTFEDKIATLNAARQAGLSICSGGIMGLGESMEDRIDMALTLRALSVTSVPINFLNPIPDTPYENNQPLSEDEKRRIIAIYRFILPKASIRLAGGRGLFPDRGEACFRSGANAAITGDMLTTAGITIETDRELIKKLNYEVKLWNE